MQYHKLWIYVCNDFFVKLWSYVAKKKTFPRGTLIEILSQFLVFKFSAYVDRKSWNLVFLDFGNTDIYFPEKI